MVKLHFLIQLKQVYMFTFTFMHLADAFIQSDLQCIQAINFFHQYVMFNKSFWLMFAKQLWLLGYNSSKFFK